MQSLILMIHVGVAVVLIVLILVQQGKGADMGAAFGSGASGTVFGSAGAGNFLTRTTAILAAIFFSTSLSLAYFSGKINTQEDVNIPSPIVQPVDDNSDTPALPGIGQSGEKKTPVDSQGDSGVPVSEKTAAPIAAENKKAASTSTDVPELPAK